MSGYAGRQEVPATLSDPVRGIPAYPRDLGPARPIAPGIQRRTAGPEPAHAPIVRVIPEEQTGQGRSGWARGDAPFSTWPSSAFMAQLLGSAEPGEEQAERLTLSGARAPRAYGASANQLVELLGRDPPFDILV